MSAPSRHPGARGAAPREGAAPACPSLRFTGPIAGLSPADRSLLFDRSGAEAGSVRARAEEIVERVRAQGDSALRALARELDGVELGSLEVPAAARRSALETLDPSLRRAMEHAAANIERWHRAGLPRTTEIETEPGVVIGRRPDPLGRVGVYAPGGRAAYPSSVLMGAIPARVAGVSEVIVCSPPAPGEATTGTERTGLPSRLVLAAAELARADRVFAIGGAGAVAAMAFGTETVPRVDRIVGPGNAYVAAAKLLVSGRVSIDSPAGPSELLAIADDLADPEAVARELLAQAEHDPQACAIAVGIGDATASAIVAAIQRLLPSQARREIVAESLASRGGVLAAPSLDEALDFARDYAPEHLLLAVSDPDAALPQVRNAGTVFLGGQSSVVFGDYMSGANHTLPTGGSSRAYSGLSTLDFVRWTTYQRIGPEAAARMAPDVAALAEAEGLPAHAAAARAWIGSGDGAGTRRRRVADGAVDPAGRAGTPPDLSRAAYRAITLYAPDRTPCEIDLSDNTNLFGLPPAARRALREAEPQSTTRYPSLYAGALKSALARYVGVDPAEITTGCGSDDVLDSAIRAFTEPGDRIAYPEPTFPMVPIFARMNGLEAVAVPPADGLEIDVDALMEAGARILYLCSPNNPTGIAARPPAIERVLREARGLIVLDEAYVEFAERSFAREAPGHGRLLVTRTLSKAFGLAGLRIGYGIGARDLVADVEKSRGPYKVNALAERAAAAALNEELDWVRERIAEVVANRARFTEALRKLGLAPLPSAANFVLVPVSDSAALASAMRRQGVAVRPFAALPRIGDALRITIGPWPMMEAALSALERGLR